MTVTLASFRSAVPMAALLPPHRTEPSDTFKGAIQFCTASALPSPPPISVPGKPLPSCFCSSRCPGLPFLSSEEPLVSHWAQLALANARLLVPTLSTTPFSSPSASLPGLRCQAQLAGLDATRAQP